MDIASIYSMSYFSYRLIVAAILIWNNIKTRRGIITDNLIGNEVVTELFSRDVLTVKHQEYIEGVSGWSYQAENLLQCLMKCGIHNWKSFVRALEETYQIHIAAVCMYNGKY